MMRALKISLIVLVIPTVLFSCDALKSLLSNEDVAAGLREALRVGTDTSVTQANRQNGYFANAAIKIFLPEEAQVVQGVIGVIPGGQTLVDEVVLKMNRAAENAAIHAGPIFLNAVQNITFQDAQQILQGPDDAATVYLKGQTKTQLANLFRPDIEDALTAVQIQQTWETLINSYNSIPLTNDINPDLAAHTTDKALDGLYHLLAVEEGKIRNDINHQVTDILRQVFGQ